ncbi:unnamed protein product [Closterium sp. Yama58-4]|nr:unnamed protein product [Closterium sp. Yama58-4]
MELISSAEGRFVTDGVAQNLRADGRTREVFRPFSLDTGVIPQATGSARLRLGATHILACVKAEIGSPAAGRPWGGRIELSVDCSPTATPAFRGRGGEELSQELTRVLERSFLGGADGSGAAVELGQLMLVERKSCWVLYLDALVLNMDGNLVDALSIAFKAALSNSVLPKVEVVMGEGEDGEPELEVVDDPDEGVPLDTSSTPIIVTLNRVRLRPDGRIVSATKGGNAGVHPSVLAEMLNTSHRVAMSLHRQVDSAMAAAAGSTEAAGPRVPSFVRFLLSWIFRDLLAQRSTTPSFEYSERQSLRDLDAPLAARYNHALAVVEQDQGDPKVYAVGGQSKAALPPDAFVEIFLREGDGWTVGSSPPIATAGKKRVGHATAVIDNTIFLVGGEKEGVPQNDILEFHTASDTWKTFEVAGTAPPPLAFHTATPVNKRIYVIGGKGDSAATTEVYVYDPKSRAWSKPEVRGTPPPARYAHAAALVEPLRIAIFGGKLSGSSENTPGQNQDQQQQQHKACSDLWLLQVDDSKPDAITVSWGQASSQPPAMPVVICGPSGVGKGTLINKLMEEFPGRCGFSVSHTTRGPRPGEEDGVHYNFTTREVMEKEIAEGRFLEKADVHGNLYGTSVAAVKKVTDSGKMCILDIDVQGARQVKASPALDAVFIFVAPPSFEELERRLRGRGTETEEQVEKRLGNARKEMEAGKDATLFNHTIINDNLDAAYAKLKALLGLGAAAETVTGGAAWPAPRSHAAAAAVASRIILHGGLSSRGAPLSDLHILDLTSLSGEPPAAATGVRCVPTHSIPTPASPSLITNILTTLGLSEPPNTAERISARFGHRAVVVGPGEVLFVGGAASEEGSATAGLAETALLSLKGLSAVH